MHPNSYVNKLIGLKPLDKMLIKRTDILRLKELSFSKDMVSIEKIPNSFKTDFDKFFFGKTLVKENNSLFAYPHDIKNWVRYIFFTYKD